MCTEEHRKISFETGKLLREGYHCAESMLFTAGKYFLGELHPQYARVGTVFSGGVGGTNQEMCGGLTGGLLVIGSLYGRIDNKADDKKVEALGKEFRKLFLYEFGSTRCADVKEWLVQQGRQGQCDLVVERSAMMLLDLLDRDIA